MVMDLQSWVVVVGISLVTWLVVMWLFRYRKIRHASWYIWFLICLLGTMADGMATYRFLQFCTSCEANRGASYFFQTFGILYGMLFHGVLFIAPLCATGLIWGRRYEMARVLIACLGITRLLAAGWNVFTS